MELTWYRTLVIVIALVVAVSGLWSRWRSGDVVDTYRARALDICPMRLAEAGFGGSARDVLAGMEKSGTDNRWEWGRFEYRSDLFADRLTHGDETFEALRTSLYTPLADGPGGESRCRMAVCIYSIPLDDAFAHVRDGQCGGTGGHRLVTPGLKPDILRQK
jgi:hypothetical protein